MYDGYSPILKLTGRVMEYDNPLWTNHRQTPFQPFVQTDFDNCIVREEYHNKAVKMVKIEVIDRNGEIRECILKKKKKRAMIDEFINEGQNQLEYVVGCRNALDLILGGVNINYHVLKPYWRFNAQIKKGDRSVRVRLGTFFSRNQNCPTKDQFK